MTAYLIVDSLLTDPDRYEAYKLQAKPIVERFGGEYLARGGAISLKESDLWSPTRMVLIRFASMAQAETFYQSAEYQAVLGISKASARRTVLLLEGLPG
ncbi:MAG: DUF1330 domain-containing protein [Rhodoferax sp.]